MEQVTNNIVPMGNVSGEVVIDLTRGGVFEMTLTGNINMTVTNGAVRPYCIIDMRQGGAGGFTVTWTAPQVLPGALANVAPNPGLNVEFGGSTAPGARCIGLLGISPTSVYQLGANYTP